MGGLGFGSLCGGYFADRANDRKRLSLFASAQAGIACFAIISPWFYYDLLYLRFGYIAKSPVLMILALFLSLLWPTFLMGISLPLLAKTLTNKIEKASEVTGYLYGFNTLGAAIGAFITTWFIVRRVGLNGAILFGAVLNFIAAFASMLSLQLFKNETDESAAINSSVLTSNEPQFLSVKNWILIYGISGFVALSLEIVWFRILGRDAEKHNVYVWSFACNFAWINGDRNTLRNLACKSKSKPGPKILRFSIRNHYLHRAFSGHLYRCTS